MATYTSSQITQNMMTLCALANISTAPRPSGESLANQQQRIQDGIGDMLQQSASLNLATEAGNWTLVWLGLSQTSKGKDANLSYIATDNSTPPNVAVVVRGTTDPLEMLEDYECGPAFASFSPASGSGPSYNVSPGFLDAFTYITTATDPPPPSNNGVTLLTALQNLVNAGTTTIYVTGHSLGGAVATMVALCLNAQKWTPKSAINLYTFAAPTAGDSGFATAVNGLPATLANTKGPACYVNYYDVVPYAYLTSGASSPYNLATLPTLYNNITSPPAAMTSGDKLLLKQVIKNVGSLVYVQPNQQPALNLDGSASCPKLPAGVTWIDELGYQHLNNTYLSLLPQPPWSDKTTYNVGDVVSSGTPSKNYISTQNSNKGNNPSVLSKWWAVSEVNAPTPTIATVTVNPNGTITITGTNFGYNSNGTFVPYKDLGVDIGLLGTGSSQWVYQEASINGADTTSTSITCTPASGQSIPEENWPFAVCVTTEYGSCKCTYPAPATITGSTSTGTITATPAPGESFVQGSSIEWYVTAGSGAWVPLKMESWTPGSLTATIPSKGMVAGVNQSGRVSGPPQAGGPPSLQATFKIPLSGS